MAQTDFEASVGRVLVSLQAGRSEAALEAALALAAAFRSQLAAVFVEDIDLLRLAALPFAQETGAISARARPLELGDVERALRGEAARLQRALAQAAAPAQLQWSFSVARGSPTRRALELAQDADLLVLGQAGAARLGIAAAPSAPELGPVVAVLGGLDSFARVLASALHLANAQQRELTLWVATQPGVDLDRQLAQAAQWLARQGRAARFATLDAPHPDSIAAKLRQQRAGTLVLARDFADLDAQQLDRLIAVALSPIVLVR